MARVAGGNGKVERFVSSGVGGASVDAIGHSTARDGVFPELSEVGVDGSLSAATGYDRCGDHGKLKVDCRG